MTEQPDGYYWVLRRGKWDAAFFDGKFFRLRGYPLQQQMIQEIGPPASMDDSEQLQKAREVLRRIRQLADTHEFVDDWVFREIIDESGVRL